ncbi:MAG: hypothetical protein A3K19_02045 [Lentisphaerae bacterium RIFOXYB12_FULL_65_16]|nr:MAG: hypothetical protein A3K18_25265 [Lentisphaerae bacterium RIFOXYA12_64_32]OGV92581.1 MAG: hypothetical protein A3K19_02045 [Lentisphaerae bacterium RIFOXYB12_FULL_65_16]
MHHPETEVRPRVETDALARSPAFRRSGNPRCFTLIELLVVIGILSVLAGTLLATGVAQAREKTQQARCALNMKRIGVAWTSFADDHDGWILPARLPAPDKLPKSFPTEFPERARVEGVWWQTLVNNGYLGTEAEGPGGLFACPTDAKPAPNSLGEKKFCFSYGYMDCFGLPYATNPEGWPTNGNYGIKHRRQLAKSHGTIPVLVESANNTVPLGGYGSWPLTKWTVFRHAGNENILYDDGSVVLVAPDDPAAIASCNGLF